MTAPNGLSRRARPTKKSYREAVKAIVLAIQGEHQLTDDELADRLGCSGPTIANARNERTNLDGVTLAIIGHEFGAGALDPYLRLAGSRAAPLGQQRDGDPDPSLTVVKALHVLIEGRRDLTALRSARTALDALIGQSELSAVRSVA